MDHETICRWLNIAPGTWPPDHYTLLGLPPGESDCARIEQQVHDRLNLIRRYQLTHPEQATAAMNLLAQAFACLTDARTKKGYDATLLMDSPANGDQSTLINRIEAEEETMVHRPPVEVNWKAAAPPPVRSSIPLTARATAPVVNGTATASSPPVEDSSTATAVAETPVTDSSEVSTLAVGAPLAKPATAEEAATTARVSARARRGLWTRRHLYERIQQTRQLVRAWEQVGRYLLRSRRKSLTSGDLKELGRWLNRVDAILQDYPQFLGQPGQPGYRLAVIAGDEDPVSRYQELDEQQRGLLIKDWKLTYGLLRTHLRYLADEVGHHRRMFVLWRWLRPVLAFLDEHAFWVVLSLIGIVLLVVLLLLVLVG